MTMNAASRTYVLFVLLAGVLAGCNPKPAPEVNLITFGGTGVISLATPLARGIESLTLDWVTLGQPGQFAIADVLIYEHGKTAVAAPAGWTLIRDDFNPPIRQLIYWHVLRADDSSAQTWNLGARVNAQGAVALLNNIAPVAPVDATSGNPGNGAANIPIANSVTTASDGDLILFFYATDYDGPGLGPLMPGAPADPHIPIPNIYRIVDRSGAEYEYWIDATNQAEKGKTPAAMCVIVQPARWLTAQVALRRAKAAH
jgi:hypothetical protein